LTAAAEDLGNARGSAIVRGSGDSGSGRSRGSPATSTSTATSGWRSTCGGTLNDTGSSTSGGRRSPATTTTTATAATTTCGTIHQRPGVDIRAGFDEQIHSGQYAFIGPVSPAGSARAEVDTGGGHQGRDAFLAGQIDQGFVLEQERYEFVIATARRAQ
jgi:hypothetical protein